MARINIDVDSHGVVKRIERAIEDGIADAGDEIQHGIKDTAQRKIRQEGAVFRYELLEGFADASLEFGDRSLFSVTNLSDHASPQEHGVSGTQVKRDTPHQYTDEAPPVEALIPWVREHLTGTGFDPWGYQS